MNPKCLKARTRTLAEESETRIALAHRRDEANQVQALMLEDEREPTRCFKCGEAVQPLRQFALCDGLRRPTRAVCVCPECGARVPA